HARDVVARNLDRGQIDADVERETLAKLLVPAGERVRCLVHGPAAKLEDEARFLGDRNELGRTDLAPVLMGPAGKRLETGDLSRLEVDQRLIKEFQLVLVERPAKLGLDRKAAALLGRLFRLIDLRPPRSFRLLDGELGIAEQLFGIL